MGQYHLMNIRAVLVWEFFIACRTNVIIAQVAIPFESDRIYEPPEVFEVKSDLLPKRKQGKTKHILPILKLSHRTRQLETKKEKEKVKFKTKEKEKKKDGSKESLVGKFQSPFTFSKDSFFS